MNALTDFLRCQNDIHEPLNKYTKNEYLPQQEMLAAELRLGGSMIDSLYVTPSPSKYKSAEPMIKDATWLPMTFGPSFHVGSHEFQTPFHYYYFMKAHMFGDEDTAWKILHAHIIDWKEMQQLAGCVKSFDHKIWQSCSTRVAYEANKYKILNEPHVLQQLLATKDKCLTWYMPGDKVWGYVNCDEDWFDVDNIHGENRMGNVLNLLRDDILALMGKPEFTKALFQTIGISH